MWNTRSTAPGTATRSSTTTTASPTKLPSTVTSKSRTAAPTPLAIYGDPAIDGQAEIWQGFMDLPPGPCTIELRARDDDGEVICTAQEPFIIAADSTTKVNIVLICDISFQAPVGMLDVDGTFSFNVGNFCPDLFILNCIDSLPQEAGCSASAEPAACRHRLPGSFPRRRQHLWRRLRPADLCPERPHRPDLHPRSGPSRLDHRHLRRRLARLPGRRRPGCLLHLHR